MPKASLEGFVRMVLQGREQGAPVPDSVALRRQLSAPLSREHSSSRAPQRFSVSFTLDSFISSKASKVSSSGILCTQTG